MMLSNEEMGTLLLDFPDREGQDVSGTADVEQSDFYLFIYKCTITTTFTGSITYQTKSKTQAPQKHTYQHYNPLPQQPPPNQRP